MSLSAVALAATMAATPPAAAQDAQLMDSISVGVSQLGIQTDGLAQLSTDQMLQIQSVLTGNDDETIKSSRIERIMAMDDGPQTGLGVAQLADSVMADMARLGIDTAGASALSLTQLSQIESVTSTSEPDDTKRQRIERIMVGDMEVEDMVAGSSAMMLRDSVSAEVSKLGLDASGVPALSLAQLGEVENIVSSGDDEGEMRARIERVMAQ